MWCLKTEHVAYVLQSKEAAEQQAASARAEAEAAQSEVAELQSSAQSAQGAEAAVHRLVELMYFATVSPRHKLQLRALMGLMSLSSSTRGIPQAL